MSRPRKGTIEVRGGKCWARLTVDIDGESIRKRFDLGTDNKAIARRKLARMLREGTFATEAEAAVEAAKPETYAELAARVHASRVAEGIADTARELSRERDWIIAEIGHLAVPEVKPAHIKPIYERARDAGKSQSHLRHLRAILRSRFAVALEEDTIQSNPLDRIKIPKVKVDRRERAVLTDEELVRYLGWQHPLEQHRLGVLERQTMSALARCFGGLRTGDLHALRWTHFDVGAFTWGVALRKKTARPQRIAVPEMLRPILRDWWQRAGRPTSGFVFPVLRGDRVGEAAKPGASHAFAMRRDLRHAFGIDEWREGRWVEAREMTPRERELLEETELTRPVDFHSWRRAFVQALADVGLNAQQAQKLAGHADLSAHERYLHNTTRTLEIPLAALPNLSSRELPKLSEPAADSSFFSVPRDGIEPPTRGFSVGAAGEEHGKSDECDEAGEVVFAAFGSHRDESVSETIADFQRQLAQATAVCDWAEVARLASALAEAPSPNCKSSKK